MYIHIPTSHCDSKCRPFCWFLSQLNRTFKIQFHGWKFPMARLPRVTCSSGFDWTHEQQASALRYLSLSSMWIFLTSTVQWWYHFWTSAWDILTHIFRNKYEGIKVFLYRRASCMYQAVAMQYDDWAPGPPSFPKVNGKAAKANFTGTMATSPCIMRWRGKNSLGVGGRMLLWNSEKTLHDFVFKSKQCMRLDSKSDLWFDMIWSEALYISVYLYTDVYR